LAGTALVALLVVLYAPLTHLMVSSVNANPDSTAWTGFTLDWFGDAIDDPEVRRAVGVSLRLAAVSAVGATVFATLAVLAVRRRPVMERLHNLSVLGRISTPEIIMATGLGALIPALGWKLGFRPMVAAHIAYLSAYAAVIIGARAAGADRTIEDAALDLGARPWRVLTSIVLPDLRPAIVSAFLLSAAFSFDDVALSLALRGPKDTTLPVLLFSRTQRRETPAVYAIGTMVLVIGVVTFLAALAANRSLLSSSGSPGQRASTDRANAT
jgi:ABC-type spermidine/putrescine transport system permease subunit II